ncbi:hypothetical protein FB565_004700 [Actinoplanes lutulentus]|uniref:Uncharacterized protein n=1 Tax=Actinoplanes lutulentus TaxID=1287878 RepID=A0A327ZAH8_9ACTN|nr:hypothetical protein [Actinoplanes lutulentus]MBB2944967.1 hypothetical protein [Actinoplanes lutulentus]RAK31761.1 hypothetical protein B0I29_1149 [Actinoplanes lutulentus]
MSVDPLAVRVERTLRRGPAETISVARRKVDTAIKSRAQRTWTKIALGMVRLGPNQNIANAEYFAVLDGHTLNLQVRLPALEDADPASAEIVFSKDRAEYQVPATLTKMYDGFWYADTTAVFGPATGRLPLDPGTWTVGLRVELSSGETRNITIRRMNAGPVRGATPTVAVPPCADTGMRFRPTITSFGLAQIIVRGPQIRAEVARLMLDLGKAEILGRFVNVADGSGAVAEFSRREDTTIHETPVHVDGDIFRIRVPLAEMAPVPGEKDIWDIRIRVGGRRLRVGRYLHDLKDIRATLRTYERRMLMPGGVVFHLRPYYTPAGSLALTCTGANPGDTV